MKRKRRIDLNYIFILRVIITRKNIKQEIVNKNNI